jgi:hypothetical protein
MMERVPLVVPPARFALQDNDGSAVLEIPADDPLVNAAAMYRQISHQRPLINGYTGHTPPHYSVLTFALARSDTSILTALARRQPLTIVVNDRADANRGFRKLIEGMPDVTLETVSAVGPVFRLPKQPPRPTLVIGRRLTAQPAETGNQRLVVDLEIAQDVAAIQFDMRGRLRDLGERILIEASDDGTTWRQVWLGWTGEFAFEATLRDPAVVPIQIPLHKVRAQYLRIYPAPAWLSDELKVIGTSP